VNVAFADLVGFTRLGQQIPAEQLGKVAAQLEETAARAMPASVSLVKTIGDAVMLVCADPEPLVDGLLALIEAGRGLGDAFPQIRAGVAAGAALERAGDWYGATVNLASRITGVAAPGTIVVTEAVRNATADRYLWTQTIPPPLKGIAETPSLYTVATAP
jgi:adenylate cyclase